MKIFITGANSSVGVHFLKLLANQAEWQVSGGVRSEKAFASLPNADNIKPVTIDYQDRSDLTNKIQGSDVVIHLAGILIETRQSNYATANVAATAAVVEAARMAGAGRIIFISVIGASPRSKNAYFRSKGTAEQLVLDSDIPATVLRTPLLLGPGTAGASSLLNSARQERARVLGGGHYVMRPLDTSDLNQALLTCCQRQDRDNDTLELVGPEGLPYRDLIIKTAQKLGHEVEIESVPVWLAKLGAAFNSVLKGGGISPTVIDVITSDEKVEQNADHALGLELTSLDDTLDNIIKQA